MKKPFWGKVRHTNATTGDTLRSARVDKGQLHMVTKQEGYNLAVCYSCHMPINTTFDNKVDIKYIHITLQSGMVRLPVTVYWHKDCFRGYEFD